MHGVKEWKLVCTTFTSSRRKSPTFSQCCHTSGKLWLYSKSCCYRSMYSWGVFLFSAASFPMKSAALQQNFFFFSFTTLADFSSITGSYVSMANPRTVSSRNRKGKHEGVEQGIVCGPLWHQSVLSAGARLHVQSSFSRVSPAFASASQPPHGSSLYRFTEVDVESIRAW